MSQPRLPPARAEQHENRVAALMVKVERDGQSREPRKPRRPPKAIGRPGKAVRVTAPDGSCLVFVSLSDAGLYLGVAPGSMWHYLDRNGWCHGKRVERV